MKNRWIYIGLPLSLFIAYILGMLIVPFPSKTFYKYMFSELGVIENATAVFFLVAGIFGAILFFKSRGLAIKPIRFIYIIFFLGSIFVALEEINYGQFFYSYQTGECFGQEKVTKEFNFHNLWDNKPARRTNLIATIGFPVVCIVLPLVGLKFGWFNPGHWAFYLLPQKELILMAIIAQLLTWLDDIYAVFAQPISHWARATEFKEFYWGLILVYYGIILSKRLQLFKIAREQIPDIGKNKHAYRTGQCECG